MKRIVIGALASLAAGIVASPAAAQMGGGGCSRENLAEIADKYIQAQTEGFALRVPTGEWVNYNENFEPSSMTYGGVLATPQTIDWHRSFYDTQNCSVYVQSIITNPEKPYVLATMLSTRGGQVNTFDVITSSTDDWLFNAERTLYYASREDWGEIPEARRNTREEIQAAADAYLDLFMDKSVEVPWGIPCARLEGSAYTGRGLPTDDCNVGVPENVAMVDRRYIIDPVVGAVAVFLRMGEKGRPDAHVFRIEDGKIRFIHTVTNCGEDVNCGFRPMAEMVRDNPGVWPELD
jgi:hypothetical protein